MSAITEIPAKTARPMGRTESCLPGSVNAGELDDAESAAEVPEGAAEESEEVEGEGVGFGLPPAALAGTADGPSEVDDAAAVGAALTVGAADAGMLETPLTTTPGSVAAEEALLGTAWDALGLAGAEAGEEEAGDTVGMAVTVDTPLTTTPDSLTGATEDEADGDTVMAPVG